MIVELWNRKWQKELCQLNCEIEWYEEHFNNYGNSLKKYLLNMRYAIHTWMRFDSSGNENSFWVTVWDHFEFGDFGTFCMLPSELRQHFKNPDNTSKTQQFSSADPGLGSKILIWVPPWCPGRSPLAIAQYSSISINTLFKTCSLKTWIKVWIEIILNIYVFID